jgi:hypothetical protein
LKSQRYRALERILFDFVPILAVMEQIKVIRRIAGDIDMQLTENISII